MAEYRAKKLYKMEIVARFYDYARFHSLKGKLYDFFEKWSVKRALKHYKGEIVDIPCGTGRITKYLSDLGYLVSGADISKHMISYAKQKVTARYYIRDIENTHFKDKEFDISVCIRMMGHLPFQNKVRALKELKRISDTIIVAFYFKPKPNWYSICHSELDKLLKKTGLVIVSKHLICPIWSDGVTYVLKKI